VDRVTEGIPGPGSQEMSVSIDERRLGGLRWIVVNGPDREAFRALGEHVRAGLATLTEAWPVLARLRQHVSRRPAVTVPPPGSPRTARHSPQPSR